MTNSRDYIPFGRPNFSDAEIEAVVSTMKKGWIGMGPQTISFENELASYLGAPHVVAVNSCTSALHLALITSGVGEGDEVICPSLTWCSSANVALFVGATPVFCDVDTESMCMTPETVKAKITEKTKAVIVVHYGGYSIDVEAIRKVLPAGVTIIEDAAHAMGSEFKDGTKVGASGNITCFSFYANKNLSTGEGGAIALANKDQADHVRSLRQHALPLDAWKRFSNPKTILLSNQLSELGYKMNYTDLNACIGRVQLKRFDELQFVRHSIAKIYVEELKDHVPRLAFQKDILSQKHACHLFVVRLPKETKLSREEIILALRAKNVGVTIHYAPLHLMDLYLSENQKPPALPNVEALNSQILTLPISSSMSESDAHYVVSEIKKVL